MRNRDSYIALLLTWSLCAVTHADDPAPAASDWAMFRGGPTLTGVATASLPAKLKVRWKFVASEAILSSAAIVDGVVYFGCDDGFLYALDLATGKQRWKYNAEEMIRSSPAVWKQTVFVGDDAGVVHAVDTVSGKRRWKFEAEDQIVSSINRSGDRLVFGSYDGFVYCVSADRGKLIWKFETAGRVHGTPGIADDLVMAAGCDEFLHVLRLADGTSASRVSLGSVSGAAAAIRGGRAFVGTYAGEMLCVDLKASRTVWRFKDPDRDFPIMASATVTDRMVLVGGRDKRFRAFDSAKGTLLWTFVTKGRVESSAVVVGKRVFVGSSDGNLYSIGLATGKELWRFESGAPISASPAVVDGYLIVGNEDGVLYCFGKSKN